MLLAPIDRTALFLAKAAAPLLYLALLGRWPCSYGQPYDRTFRHRAESLARLLYGRDADKRAALRRGAQPMARVARRPIPDLMRR